MVHVDYDSTLVMVSILVAVATCYAAFSMGELVFKTAYKKFEKSILVASGLILVVILSVCITIVFCNVSLFPQPADALYCV